MDVQKVMNTLQHLFFTLDTTPYVSDETAIQLAERGPESVCWTVITVRNLALDTTPYVSEEVMRDRMLDAPG